MLHELIFSDELKHQAGLLLLMYSGILLVMLIDLITGIRKARIAGKATTSKGLRKTAQKAMQYFLPMLVLTAIDLVTATITSYPYLSGIFFVFICVIEFISVYENTHGEGSIKNVAKGLKIVVKDKADIPQLVSDIMEYVEAQKDITCEDAGADKITER